MNQDPNRITAAMEITKRTTARAFMSLEQRAEDDKRTLAESLARIEAAMVLGK